MKFEQFTKDGKEKPYTLSQHEYKGYMVERFYRAKPFHIKTPDGKTLYFRPNNSKGYNRISFAEICRRIDNGTLDEFYVDIEVEKVGAVW